MTERTEIEMNSMERRLNAVRMTDSKRLVAMAAMAQRLHHRGTIRVAGAQDHADRRDLVLQTPPREAECVFR